MGSSAVGGSVTAVSLSSVGGSMGSSVGIVVGCMVGSVVGASVGAGTAVGVGASSAQATRVSRMMVRNRWSFFMVSLGFDLFG